jgi:hypothetical protein
MFIVSTEHIDFDNFSCTLLTSAWTPQNLIGLLEKYAGGTPSVPALQYQHLPLKDQLQVRRTLSLVQLVSGLLHYQ